MSGRYKCSAIVDHYKRPVYLHNIQWNKKWPLIFVKDTSVWYENIADIDERQITRNPVFLLGGIEMYSSISNMSEIRVKRLNNIDKLRCICAFLVVYVHAPISGEIGLYLSSLARAAVPIFFIISGYFYTLSSSGRQIKICTPADIGCPE